MPLNDDALFIAARGYVYTAPSNTASPTVADIEAYTAEAAVSGWDNAGHTDLDELPEFSFDGGESEIRGTWQKRTLRSISADTPVDSVLIRFAQFDSSVLSFYYGAANTSGEAGRFRVATSPTSSIERALLIVIMDGTTNVGFYAPRASLKRDASVEMAADNYAFLPVRATLLQGTDGPSGDECLFDWISNDTAIVGS